MFHYFTLAVLAAFIGSCQNLPKDPPQTATETMPSEQPQTLKLEPSFDFSEVNSCDDSIYSSYLKNAYKDDFRKLRNRRSRQRLLDQKIQSRLEGPMVQNIGGMPFVMNSRVQMWVDYFETRGRSAFLTWLVRGEHVRQQIQDVLIEEGVPRELFYLAMIESGFSNQAYSRARAVGTWQFMKATGSHYGLTINYWLDERRDPEKSTRAAARFLKDLYHQFGDWYLAMAAYNAGPGRIRSAIRRSRTKDFWQIAETRYIRSETKNYIPKFLAAMLLAQRAKQEGYTLRATLSHQIPQSYVTLYEPRSLKNIANKLGIRHSLLKQWNPELLQDYTPPKTQAPEGYRLRLAPSQLIAFNEIRSQLDTLEIKDVKMYTVQSGDTLSTIARRHRISLSKLRKMNPKIHPRRLRPGKEIAIPIPAVIRKKTG